MKLIFLDIDGVLATEDSSLLPKHKEYSYPFDADCVNVFNQILESTNAEIVLSSDWKHTFSGELKSLEDLFKFNGVNKSPIDLTPNIGLNRNKEIASYIYKHRKRISSFLILDDFNLNIHSLRFIRTDLKHGLSENGLLQRSIEMLNQDQSNILTCINCGNEFLLVKDKFCCSTKCRSEIESIKLNTSNSISDNEILEFQLYNLIEVY